MDLRSLSTPQRGALIRASRERAGISQRRLQHAFLESVQLPWRENQRQRMADIEGGRKHISAERTQDYLDLIEKLAATEGGDGGQPPTPPDWRQKATERRTSRTKGGSGGAS